MRLEALLECRGREPYEWPVPISRDDLKALLKGYKRQHPLEERGPRDPYYVRRVLHDRDTLKLPLKEIAYRYSVSKVAIFKLCVRWRAWAAKNPVDTPAQHC